MNKKAGITIILIAGTILVSFALPKPKYTSPDALSKLAIPESFNSWRSRDVSSEVNTGGDIYNFVSRVFARQYVRPAYSLLDRGIEGLTFLILDAGNFHNPKVCYGASGFDTQELPDIEFNAAGRKIKASAVYFQKKGRGTIIIYWICIDKKQVNWIGQKFIELWYTLFQKQKVGLMVRIDVPATLQTLDKSINLAKQFVWEIASKLTAEDVDYLFGK